MDGTESPVLIDVWTVDPTREPELLNRIDEVVVFHTLEQEHLRKIVDLMIEKTRHRMAELSISMQVSDATRRMLIEHGYDPTYGARSLRRTVQSMLDDMLAEALLRGDCKAGDAVVVDVEDGKMGVQVLVGVESSKQVAA